MKNLRKAKSLASKGFIVGTVGFKTRSKALTELKKSGISDKRKKRLSVRKFTSLITKKPVFVFVEKKSSK